MIVSALSLLIDRSIDMHQDYKSTNRMRSPLDDNHSDILSGSLFSSYLQHLEASFSEKTDSYHRAVVSVEKNEVHLQDLSSW